MSMSYRKSTIKIHEVTIGDQFSVNQGHSGGGGAKKSLLYASPVSESGRKEPQEPTIASSSKELEADLSKLNEGVNVEEASSGFISEYAAWRRKNHLYIDGILFIVLAVMAWYIVAGMFSGISTIPDPLIDRTCEKKIQSFESRFDGQIQDLKNILNSDISDFKSTEFASISSEFDSIKREYEGLKSSTQQRMNEVQTNMAGLMEENDEFKNKQNHALKHHLLEFESDLKTFKENLETGMRKEQSRKIHEIEDGVNEKINGGLGDIQGGIDDLTVWRKEVETWQLQSEGKMHVLHEQGYDTNTIVILVLVMIVFIVILVIMIMIRQMNLAVQNAVGRSQAIQGGQDPASRLLKTVQRDCAKEKTVCILYFSKQSKQFCVNLTKTVEPDTEKLRQFFLYSDSDIQTIPRSKVIIVYVEKNERNIILEDPKQELGNLRRTTVEAARIMGATVVVVYMHHEESRNLGKEELYCPALYSVTRHYVLSKLEKQGAVLSVYDSFSEFQQKHLKDLFLKSVV